jgi:hypothetical protein
MLNRCPDKPGAKLAAGPIQGWRPVISQRVFILPKCHTAEAITRTATKSPGDGKGSLVNIRIRYLCPERAMRVQFVQQLQAAAPGRRVVIAEEALAGAKAAGPARRTRRRARRRKPAERLTP